MQHIHSPLTHASQPRVLNYPTLPELQLYSARDILLSIRKMYCPESYLSSPSSFLLLPPQAQLVLGTSVEDEQLILARHRVKGEAGDVRWLLGEHIVLRQHPIVRRWWKNEQDLERERERERESLEGKQEEREREEKNGHLIWIGGGREQQMW